MNLADSGDNLVDFDLSESKYTANVPTAQNETPRNGSGVKIDPALISMDSMDFGLSESNFSAVNFSAKTNPQRSQTEI